MKIVSLQNLLKHQQRAEGIPFSPLKCLLVGGLTRGDTWRGFFGISAENWVNLYSEVLHLKIGRAPKSGKFRWSSICYSGAFWNRAICKNFEERRKPQQVTTKNHKILQQSQNPTKILTNLLVGHQTFAELVKNQKTNNKNHHPNWTQGSWSIVRVMLFLGWSSRASIWSCKSRGSSGGQGGCCRFGWFPWENICRFCAPRFGCKDLLLGKHLLQHFEIFGAWGKNGEGYSFRKRVEGGLKGKNIIWKWSWRYESQTGLGTT